MSHRPSPPVVRVSLAAWCALAAAALLPSCSRPGDLKQAHRNSPGTAANETVADPGQIQRTPLAPRRPANGALFQRVSASRSGLDFVHHWAPENKADRGLIATAFAGGGVALGDIDNDGLPDIFLTRPHGGSRQI